MHNNHNQMKIKVGLRKFRLKLTVKSKEKVQVKGGDPHHLIGWQK